MKKIFTLLLLTLFIDQRTHAQNYLPVPTTGYSLDAIAENTTALLTTSGVLDGGGHVFYSQAYGVIVGSLYGLPNSGTFTSPTRTFQLQSYTAPNALYLPAVSQIDSLILITPAAFSTLSLLGFATEADGTMSVTVRFMDNSTQVFAGITVYDWFNAATPFASGFDRMNRSTGVLANVGAAGNPRFFTHDLPISCANQGKMVKRIIIKNTSTSSKIVMWAVAGAGVPLNAGASPTGLCNAGTSTLSGTGQTTYTWLPVGSFAGATGNTVAVSPTSTTDYTVQSVTASNCTLNAIVTVNVYSGLPVLSLTNTANAGGVCPGTTVNLTAGGAVTYTWAGGAAATITNGIAFAPTGGNYTVTGGNACGTSQAFTSVSVHPLPVVTPAASAPTLCAGGTLTLTATGNATNYIWSGGTAPAGNGVGFTPPVSNTTYSVTGTSALSCTALATVPVTVYATPNAAPVASSTLSCIGSTVTLTASGAINYTWSSSTQTLTGNPQFTFTPATAGLTTYTVIKGNSSCMDTKTISVTTNPLPTVSAAATQTQVCSLRPTTLSATGGISYTWTAPGSPNFTFTGANPIAYPVVNSIYTVAASDGTCINRATVSVSALANPTITTTASSPSICSGQAVTVTASGGINYTWTAVTGTFYTSSVTDSPTAPIAYAVTGDNASGCTSSTQQIVLVQPSPVISIAASMPVICNGDASILTAAGADTYTWSPGSTVGNNLSVNPVSATSTVVTYSVSGSFSSTGCQSGQTTQVIIYVPTLAVSGNTSVCSGGQISLTATGGDAGTYNWNTGSSTSNFPTLVTTLLSPAIFTITAGSASISVNCPVTKTVAVNAHPQPTVTATAQRTVVCQKESVQLFAGGAATYSWSNASSGATITVSPSLALNNYVVTGTDANGCAGTGTVLVTQSACTGIEGLQAGNSGISIYPNPNNGRFTVEANAAVTLTLINELGQVVGNIDLLQENAYKVSLTGLPAGIYFLSGKAGENSFSRKIVVAK